MAGQEFIAKLVDEIEEMKRRVAEQTARIERSVGDDLFEDRATLRNLIMRLDGLQAPVGQIARTVSRRLEPNEKPGAFGYRAFRNHSRLDLIGLSIPVALGSSERRRNDRTQRSFPQRYKERSFTI